MKILIADDHAIFREGLRSLLAGRDGVSVVGETGLAAQVPSLVRNLRPDVVIMDISMPDGNGIDVARRISRKFENVAVVMLSMHADQDRVLSSLRAGARGYVSKESAMDELLRALDAVERGGVFLSPAVSTGALLSALARRDARADGTSNPLTVRQEQILRLLAMGKPTREIALRLGISVKTVESHRAGIMERLQIFSVAGLVRFAVRRGLVRLD